MGARGLSARPLSKRAPTKLPRGRQGSPLLPPWSQPGLTRSQRVIVFCETFTITSGPDIGKLFVLRPWQRKFIKSVYRDDSGIRPVRTAILSMGAKTARPR